MTRRQTPDVADDDLTEPSWLDEELPPDPADSTVWYAEDFAG